MSDDDGHDFGNLFGSGDEASDLEGEQSLSPSPGPQARSPSPEANAFDSEPEQSDNERKASKRPARQLESDNEETSGRNDDFDNNDEEEYGSDQDYGTQKKQRIEVDVRMPSLPLPVTSDGKFYLAKVPRFLDIETEQFDLEQIRAQNEGSLGQGHDERVLQQMEHTLRWRLGVDDYGDTITESNAHFVEWEDGTTSLLVGNQLFDATRKTLGKEEHTYLLAHQTSSGVLESQLEVTDQMTFRPYDIHSDTHRQLSGSVSEQAKKIKTKMFFTEKDPEAVRNSVEKEEQERQKAQKKLESQRKRADDRYATTTSHRVTDNYEYDDFVDDEEEEEEEEEEEQEYSSGEEEERERRLNRLKRTADF